MVALLDVARAVLLCHNVVRPAYVVFALLHLLFFLAAVVAVILVAAPALWFTSSWSLI